MVHSAVLVSWFSKFKIIAIRGQILRLKCIKFYFGLGSARDSVTALQTMLWLCEQELNSIDMVINVRKSCYMRVDTLQDKSCSNINTIDGR